VALVAGLAVRGLEGVPAGVEIGDVQLREWPMVYTHNAGTGYLLEDGSNVFVRESASSVYESASPSKLVDLARNQVGGFYEQLECGARALNVRPQVHEGELKMHHGDVGVDVTLSLALDEVVRWAGENPAELVVLTISDCGGDNCEVETETLLDAKGVPLHKNCSILGNLTVTEARIEGELKSGGSVVCFAEACLNQNYDEQDLARCYAGGGDCKTGATQPFDDLKDHLLETTANPLTANELTHQNAHWQYTNSDIVTLFVNGGSIIEDTDESDVNAFVGNLVQNGELQHINLLQVDHVCDNRGEDVYVALGTYSASQNFRTTLAPTISRAPTSSPSNAASSFNAAFFLIAVMLPIATL